MGADDVVEEAGEVVEKLGFLKSFEAKAGPAKTALALITAAAGLYKLLVDTRKTRKEEKIVDLQRQKLQVELDRGYQEQQGYSPAPSPAPAYAHGGPSLQEIDHLRRSLATYSSLAPKEREKYLTTLGDLSQDLMERGERFEGYLKMIGEGEKAAEVRRTLDTMRMEMSNLYEQTRDSGFEYGGREGTHAYNPDNVQDNAPTGQQYSKKKKQDLTESAVLAAILVIATLTLLYLPFSSLTTTARLTSPSTLNVPVLISLMAIAGISLFFLLRNRLHVSR